MTFDGFDWDGGNLEKCTMHGVSIAEIERLFDDTPRVGPDKAHSGSESRFRAIGKTSSDRAVFVVFTWRLRGGAALVRPISARYMHRREIEAYEKDIS